MTVSIASLKLPSLNTGLLQITILPNFQPSPLSPPSRIRLDHVLDFHETLNSMITGDAGKRQNSLVATAIC